MNYRDMEEYLNDIPRFSKKNTMEDTKAFLRHLGSPEQSMRIIHVAGTNGKGSVCAYLTSILTELGYHVGTFISPHLVTTRERFLYDREMVSEKEFETAFCNVQKALQDLPEDLSEKEYHPSFFEYLFFMGMLIFREKKPDFLILETGLGGRLDATNSVDNKEVCVITSIGYDHMEYLGETLPEIAREKAGIMRQNVPVVFWDKDDEVSDTFKKCAKECHAIPLSVTADAVRDRKVSDAGIDFSYYSLYYNYVDVCLKSKALYQVENAVLALRCAEYLLRNEKPSAKLLGKGLYKMEWQGRMEEIHPHIYLDGAHNVDGIDAFLETVSFLGVNKKCVLLYSVVADKQYQDVIERLVRSDLFTEYHIVEMESYRALSLEEMKETFLSCGISTRCHNSVKEALINMIEIVSESDDTEVFIAGSLYLAGEIKACLSEEQE